MLPVKEIFLSRGSSHIALPMIGVVSWLAVTTLTTPSGKPALVQSTPRAAVLIGVSGEGLMTIVHPAAKADAILRIAMTTGKFHLTLME